MPTPTTVDDYLASLPEDRRVVVETMRATIRAAAPMANETIAYSMPALRSDDGRFLVSYASYEKHYSLFPASGAVVETLGADLAPYLAAKATIQFPITSPVPLALVARVVEIRVAELGERKRR
jgi:uncharacterized protein YdhG (YjbR/CyaY superfamily)